VICDLFPLTDKFDLPDAVWQEQRLLRQELHLGQHLAEDGLDAVGSRQSALAARPLHLYAVQLDDRPVLAVADHRGLHHLRDKNKGRN
jgi:hypothetical protein